MTIYSSNLTSGTQGTTGEKNAKTYSDTYTVISDKSDNQYFILSNYPDIGFPYFADSKAKLSNKRANLKSFSESKKVWEVELTYTSSTETDIAPWLKPLQLSYDEDDYEKEITKDINGKLITNKAKDIFLDRLMIAASHPTFSIVKNYQTYNYLLENKLAKTINKKKFLFFPPGTIQKQKTSAQNVDDDKWGRYVTVTRTFKYSDDWKLHLDNVGLRYLGVNGDGEERLFDILKGGQPITQPVALTEDGKEMPLGNKPIELEFEIFNSYDFNKWYPNG